MNANSSDRAEPAHDPMKRKLRTVIVLAVIAVAYVLLRPTLERRLGIELPPLIPQDEAVVAEQDEEESRPQVEESSRPEETPAAIEPENQSAESRPDLSDRSVAEVRTTTSQPVERRETTPRRTDANSTTTNPPKLGELKETRSRVYVSTAGLEYRPARNEHRLEHVMRHAEDDPGRPVHGVFTGTKAEILALIDEAWLLAQRGRPPTVRKETDRDRTAYTINMNRRIGFKGGQSGKRSNHPACRHLKLVVEGNVVITAYPVTD